MMYLAMRPNPRRLHRPKCLRSFTPTRRSVSPLTTEDWYIAATEADRAGVSFKHIQKWLGHKDPRTTERHIPTGQDLDRSPAYVLRFG
jgi:integrase